jgi:hypothetical protein
MVAPAVLFFVLLTVSLSCRLFASNGNDVDADADKATEIALGVEQTMAAQPQPDRTTQVQPTHSETQQTPEQVLPTGTVAPESDSPALINPSATAPGDIYYDESFDVMEGWWVFPLRGDPNGWGYELFDNRLRAEIVSQDTWVYYMFEGAGDFQDIRVDITVENRASNTNFVGIICRSSSRGWYEANILNTGEYFIYYGYPDSSSVDLMDKGATYGINTGRSTNSYALTCQEEKLTLEINGLTELSLPLKTGDFRFLENGQVGLSVSTSFAIPVMVDFLSIMLSVP